MSELKRAAARHPVRHDCSLLTADDLYLFNEGRHYRLYDKLRAHPGVVHGTPGVHFAVWAPSAEYVSVIGDFNGWDRRVCNLLPRENSGIWEGFVENVRTGTPYKYHVRSSNGFQIDKADPVAFAAQIPPATSSVVADLTYTWGDEAWMRDAGERNGLRSPMSIYEVHLGSWRRIPEEKNRSLSYREIAPYLIEHVLRAGFTHVELMPVMEHPFYGSWGYQTTGYFAATSRYGPPQDLMYLIDQLHQNGIGVLLDWVPSHFATDAHGLSYFDGTNLYEHRDPRQGFHPDWKSFIFNYGRAEVQSFLISSALYWLDRFHADGLRVDAVSSMLYLDYSRSEGQWVPNIHGGRENLESIHVLRQLNQEVYHSFPDVQMIAEESTAWPMVSRPLYLGGLGFGMKWDMGWMHDTLHYMARDPIHRRYHHNELTFRMVYAYTENYVLSLSHDEVVHGKGSLVNKMPGDDWQKFANLRLLYGYMFGQPGKKLLFMGGEIGQFREWSHESSLDWHLLAEPLNRGLLAWMADLNRAYRTEPALHLGDCDPSGFRWVDASDSDHTALSFLRCGPSGTPPVLVVCNFTPQVVRNYRVGVPARGFWKEILNSDSQNYGGSGQGNLGGVAASPIRYHGLSWSLNLTLPPLGAVFLRPE